MRNEHHVRIQSCDRRGFLKAGAAAAGGLFVGFHLPESDKLEAAATSAAKLNAFVHIGTTIPSRSRSTSPRWGRAPSPRSRSCWPKSWSATGSKIRTEFAPVDPAYGPLQGAFGSMSIRTSWEPLRKAGAAAREMLLEAAAQKWGVDKSQCRAENGFVINTATNARLSYGSLAEAAAKLPVPAERRAERSAAQFKLIGTSPKRLDTPAKVNGSAEFGIDVRRPGMVYAVVAALPGVRRQGRQFRRHESEGRARRARKSCRSRTASP